MATVRTVTTGHSAAQTPWSLITRDINMATELSDIVRKLFDDLDRLDVDAVVERFAADVQAVEEIRRRWMRSRDELGDYFAQLKQSVSDIKSQLTDIHEITWGDAGLVTCWLEQSYVLDGEAQHVSAPTTFVFRREDGAWKAVLAHSVPVPESE
ncbi:MAG TPA: nuclear transport factor 2 family protein [Nocardioidaceae bacterium]|nr:nuclear transport factor 2 family protein [Nocardioidaceae bacterium]